MSAHTAKAHGHDAHAAHPHDDHGGHGSGPDPMVVKMGAMFGIIFVIIVVVSVFSYVSLPAHAQVFKRTSILEPVILPPSVPQEIPNTCDMLSIDSFIVGSVRCR